MQSTRELRLQVHKIDLIGKYNRFINTSTQLTADIKNISSQSTTYVKEHVHKLL